MPKLLRLHRLDDRKAVLLNPDSFQRVEHVAGVEGRPAMPARPSRGRASNGKAWPPPEPARPAQAAQEAVPESAIIHFSDSTIPPLHVFETPDMIHTAIADESEIVDDRLEAKERREAEEQARKAFEDKIRADNEAAKKDEAKPDEQRAQERQDRAIQAERLPERDRKNAEQDARDERDSAAVAAGSTFGDRPSSGATLHEPTLESEKVAAEHTETGADESASHAI